MKYSKQFTLVILLLCIQGWVPSFAASAETIDQQIDEAILKGSGFLENLGRKAPESAVPRIKGYLKHPSFGVRQNAFRVLASMPSEATAVILAGLRSADEAIWTEATKFADVMATNREIQEAWIEAVTRPTEMSSGGLGAEKFLTRLDKVDREYVLSGLIPRLLKNLRNYSTYKTCASVVFLGRHATPGDRAVLQTLSELREDVRGNNREKWEWMVEMDMGPERAEEAILFAEANLGVATAMQTFAHDLIEGSTEVKKSRILLLKRFRPTRTVLELALKALDDRTDVLDYSIPGQFKTEPNFYRMCDITVDALAEWFPDLPVKHPRWHAKYKDEEIKQNKEWLQARIKSMEE